jgi:hypothetical protein
VPRPVFRLPAALLLVPSQGVFAQPADQPGEIIVEGRRLAPRIPPERTLSSEDLSAFGVDSVSELIEEIATENGDQTADPVILVNGSRTAGLGSVADLPPEAIARIEVLPIGSGAAIGESAARRVYNIVVRRQADIIAVRASTRFATEGGGTSVGGDVTATHIRGERRVTGAARVRNDARLLEADRSIVQPEGSPPELGRFRTLRPQADRQEARITFSEPLAAWLTGSGEFRIQRVQREALLGLTPLQGEALQRSEQEMNISGNGFLLADVSRWSVSLSASADQDVRRVGTDRIGTGNAVMRTLTFSTLSSIGLGATATGPILNLPAGAARGTIGGDIARTSLTRERQLGGIILSEESSDERSSSARVALWVPLASRSKEVLEFLGDLSASFEYGVTHIEGFGTLPRRTFSFSWEPVPRWRIAGSLGRNRAPVSLALRAAPALETPGVRVFDPVTGQTVDIVEVSGGSPNLRPSRRAEERLSLSAGPFGPNAFRPTLEYNSSVTTGSIGGLPSLSAQVATAFPERFLRNGAGDLILVDVRPIQFDRLSERRLRAGINLTIPLGARARPSHSPSTADDQDDEDAPARSAAGSRLQLSANVSHLMESSLVLREGVPPIDLLSLQAVEFGGAARPRNEVDATLAYAERGLGVRLTAAHREGTALLLGEGDAGLLRFGPLTTFTIRAFAEGRRLFPRTAFFKGTRINVTVANLDNSRQQATSASGEIPLAYQAAYRNPLGRTVEVAFRKVF